MASINGLFFISICILIFVIASNAQSDEMLFKPKQLDQTELITGDKILQNRIRCFLYPEKCRKNEKFKNLLDKKTLLSKIYKENSLDDYIYPNDKPFFFVPKTVSKIKIREKRSKKCLGGLKSLNCTEHPSDDEGTLLDGHKPDPKYTGPKDHTENPLKMGR